MKCAYDINIYSTKNFIIIWCNKVNHPEHKMFCITGFFHTFLMWLIMHYFLLQLTTSTLAGIGSCENCFQA